MLKRNAELQFDPKELENSEWFASDLLDRKPHIKAITDLLLTTEGQFVMTLGAPWGTGKTTFMRMWKAYLEHRGHACVLFNAWENDFAENPFLTFIAEMHEQLCTLGGKGQKARINALKGLTMAGRKLFPKLLSAGVRMGFGVSVSFEQLGKKLFGDEGGDLKNVGENITKILSDSAEAYASDVLEEHQETKALVKEFKGHLERVAENLGEKEKPLFFFVDELDRCKPTYSIELLEAVKHLFETKGIIFILSLDRKQLGNSVKAAYGNGIDSDGYLRRFIDLEYRIPDPEKKKFILHLGKSYAVQEYNFFKLSQQSDLYDSYIGAFILVGIKKSLRDIEKAFLRGTILLRGLRPLEAKYSISISSLVHYIFLRDISVELFDECLLGKIYLERMHNDKFSGIDVEQLKVLYECKQKIIMDFSLEKVLAIRSERKYLEKTCTFCVFLF